METMDCMCYDITHEQMVDLVCKGKMCNHYICWKCLTEKVYDPTLLRGELLCRAVENNWVELVVLVLSKGVDKTHLMECSDAICIAIKKNNLPMLKILLPERLTEQELINKEYLIYHLAADVYKKTKDPSMWKHICDLDIKDAQTYGYDDAYIDYSHLDYDTCKMNCCRHNLDDSE